MLPRSILRLLAALCVWAAANNGVHAQGQFFFITDHAGYTGSWGFYSTLADAQNNTNLKSSGTIPQLNLGVYLTNGIYPPGGSAPNSSIITTNWYSSKDPKTPGVGNTSNQSLGFFQIYNDPANATTKNNAFWSQDLKSITVNETAQNVKGVAGKESRFSPLAGLGFADTQGEFLSYAFTATASGLNGVPNNGSIQDIGLDKTAKLNGFSGSLNAIFQNTVGLGNPSLDGFYSINLNFNNISSLDGTFTNFINPNQFASNTVIPEPASCLTFGLVFAASAGFGWRKSRQRRHSALQTA